MAECRLGTCPYSSACVAPRQASWSSSPETRTVFCSMWIPARPYWKCWTINGYKKGIPLWDTVFQALQSPYQCCYFCAYRTSERELQCFRASAESWGVPGSRYSTSSHLAHLWLISGKVLKWMGREWGISFWGNALKNVWGWARNWYSNLLFSLTWGF